MAEYQVVGKSLCKPEALDKVTGRAKYGADFTEARFLTAKVLGSSYPSALIKDIDISRAQGLPGVWAVVTAQDAPDVRIGRWIKDRQILARGKVRYKGEPVAAVAAVDEETAEEALGLIRVEYDPLPGVFDPFDALKEGAPIIHEKLAEYAPRPPQRKTGGNIVHQAHVLRGKPEEAMAGADVICEASYSTPRWHQGFIEPHACVASPGAGGDVTIWSSTKSPFDIRSMVAKALQLPPSKVRVVATAIGGDFGGKGSASIEPLAALLALKAGRPVRLALSRREELTATYVRTGSRTQITMGAMKDGTIVAVKARTIYDSGAYFDSGGAMAPRAFMLCGPYEIPNLDLEVIAVYTNNLPSGHNRGPFGPQGAFAVESHIDALASELGMDPLELRLRHAVKDGSVLAGGTRVRGVGLTEALAKTATYLKEHPVPSKKAHCGWGVASAHWHQNGLPGGLPESSAQVRLNEDGSLTLFTANPDSGGGQHTIFRQIISEVLKAPCDSIRVVAADTDINTQDGGTGGQRTTYQVGTTIKLAAESLKRQLFEFASNRLEASVKDLEMAAGKVHVKGSPEKAIPFNEFYAAAVKGPGPMIGLSSDGREEALAEMVRSKGIADAPCYGAVAAQVEVDPETGQVKLTDYFAAYDIGFAINPSNVEGQIEGGAAYGLGNALMEHVQLANGEVQNPNFHDYRIPTAADVCSFSSALLEIPCHFGPYGAKGLGETVNQAVAPAVANAVANAVGVRVTELPITAERLLAALKKV